MQYWICMYVRGAMPACLAVPRRERQRERKTEREREKENCRIMRALFSFKKKGNVFIADTVQMVRQTEGLAQVHFDTDQEWISFYEIFPVCF